MKKIYLLAFLLPFFSSPEAQALSFAPDTVFLEAETKAECEAQGGGFIEWEGEAYCTQSAEVKAETSTETAPEPSNKSSFTADTLIQTFSDVSSSHVNFEAIGYMQTQNIISGYPDGSFQPSNAINRAELTKIIIALNYEEAEIQACNRNDIGLSDVSADAWFAPFICLAKNEGIIKGYDDGTFKPANNINVAEASKIIGKALRPSLSDGSDIWFRPYVEFFSSRKALPTSLGGFDQSINRGEVSEMIYRVKQEIKTKDSLEYGEGVLSAPAIPAPVEETNQTSEETSILSCAKCEDGYMAVNQTENSCGQCVLAEASNAEYQALSVESLQAFMGKKKMALFFHADWCPSCRSADARIQENIGSFPNNSVVLKADYDKEIDLRKKFGVTQQHTVVVIDTSNKVTAKIAGFTLDQLKEALK